MHPVRITSPNLHLLTDVLSLSSTPADRTEGHFSVMYKKTQLSLTNPRDAKACQQEAKLSLG